mmetsp:Transcript_54125/g.114999  ORF Transcript_54125/g.114999 Transcript_54125/m.114999 type:complete len:254 (+) Transcript_54125:125-886(+)|eukprot:CAMPEP_0172554978 /NCGR_PEP_ID=MMETSP1067-20121228/57413_1 /TAXON_ID=265564 ORGANISM="Thalassiosira punctigera, Strain Tpunct2005C2" /NCGR_SAMPLE_ID=MMETSP1067 /ASSEMBLY_ACC=CAM_ASM_000444 /LENGTH=253 /DNA_ID=CAMNT_0013343467 /DNA_START=57 /DNA_END=818 /DNA_ORIENTATION=-
MASLSVQVATGMLCASYWRGAWYVLDHTLYPENRLASGAVSLAAGSCLLGMKQHVLSPSYNGTKYLVRMLPPPKNISLRTRYVQTNRFVILYGIASACVLIWRGTWLLWDEGAHRVADALSTLQPRLPQVGNDNDSPAKLNGNVAALIKQRQPLQQQQLPQQMLQRLPLAASPHKHQDHHGESTVTDHDDADENVLFYSGIASHVVATAGLLFLGRFASVMAPPANVSMIKDVFVHGRGKEFARAARSFTHSH